MMRSYPENGYGERFSKAKGILPLMVVFFPQWVGFGLPTGKGFNKALESPKIFYRR